MQFEKPSPANFLVDERFVCVFQRVEQVCQVDNLHLKDAAKQEETELFKH